MRFSDRGYSALLRHDWLGCREAGRRTVRDCQTTRWQAWKGREIRGQQNAGRKGRGRPQIRKGQWPQGCARCSCPCSFSKVRGQDAGGDRGRSRPGPVCRAALPSWGLHAQGGPGARDLRYGYWSIGAGMREPSDLEDTFLFYWKVHAPDMPPPEREARLNPDRRWRYDLTWPEWKVAVELHGSVYQRGRHTRGAGFEKDREKMNWATSSGWCVLEYTPGMLKSDPSRCIGQVVALLSSR